MPNDTPDWTRVFVRPQSFLFKLVVPVSGNANQTEAIDANTHSIGLLMDNPGNLSQLQVQGVQSGVNYYSNADSGLPISTQHIKFVPVFSDVDTSVKVTGACGSGGACNIWVSAVDDPEAVLALGDPTNILYVSSNNPNLSPAGWQAANAIFQFSINMSTTGVKHVIAAPPVTSTIRLFSIFAVASAAGAFAGNWQDTAGNQISSDTLQVAGPRLMTFHGSPLPGGAGVGLDFNVTNAGASFLIGHVAFSE